MYQSYLTKTLKNIFSESLKKEIEINANYGQTIRPRVLIFKMPHGIVERVDFTPGATVQVPHLLQTY